LPRSPGASCFKQTRRLSNGPMNEAYRPRRPATTFSLRKSPFPLRPAAVVCQSKGVPTKAQDGWAVITLDGEIDMARLDELARLFESNWDHQSAGLIVDLTPVTFIDSSGLGWLLRIQPEVVKDGGRLRIVVREGPVQRLFDLSGLDGQLPTFSSLDAAMDGR
jgi:anti-sigma B factor antagonist